MALKRVTMQEIADACGLSRNTISKVFNGRGSVPEATRKTVIDKAKELGYYQFPEEKPAEPMLNGTIALLTQHKLLTHAFGSFFMSSFSDQISRSGYTLKIFEISPEELAQKQTPPHLILDETIAVLGIEIFDREYIDMICSLGKPTVFIDAPAQLSMINMSCDIISMENISSEFALVDRMIQNGAKSIGFVGDIAHCNSFFERWVGFNRAMANSDLPVDRSLCILDKDSDDYGNTEWLIDRITSLPKTPDAFACCNDYLALHLMTALKRLGHSIPKDIMVCGFDGSVEASLFDPSLSTVSIPSAEIGRIAALTLFDRVKYPDSPFLWIYVKTAPVFGESTR